MGKRFDMMQDGKMISLNLAGGIEPAKIGTIGQLRDYLAQFPQTWAISIPSDDGLDRQMIYIKDCQIASVLTSCGPEVQY